MLQFSCFPDGSVSSNNLILNYCVLNFNGLPSVQCQAIISANIVLLSIDPPRANFGDILIEFQRFLYQTLKILYVIALQL